MKVSNVPAESFYEEPLPFESMVDRCITRELAEQMLHNAGLMEGSFVLRPSKSNPDCFVLVAVAGGEIKHYPVDRKSNGSYTLLFAGHERYPRYFDSLRALIEYYTAHFDLPSPLKKHIF